MTIGMNLRKLLSGSTLALALAASLVIAPAGANADESTGTTVTADHVCNIHANAKHGESLTDAETFADGTFKVMKGQGNGLLNAASHSSALDTCGTPKEADLGATSIGDPVDVISIS